MKKLLYNFLIFLSLLILSTKAISQINETENLSGTDKFQTIYALLIIILPPLFLLMSNRGREYSNTPDGFSHTGFWIRALASTVDLIIFTILGFITMVTFKNFNIQVS